MAGVPYGLPFSVEAIVEDPGAVALENGFPEALVVPISVT